MKHLLHILLLFCPLTMSADKYQYYYIEAVRQQDMGNYISAYEMFQRCHELNPDAPEANYALGNFHLALSQDSVAIAYLKRATELAPKNDEYSERLAQAYLYKNDAESAAEVYEKIVAQRPDRTEFLNILLKIYQQQRNYPKQLATLSKLELQEGMSEDITLEKMNIYSQMGNKDGARCEMLALINAHPFDLNLQVMLGNWYINNGQQEEALATYLKVLQEEPDNAQAQMSLMDFYRAKGDNTKADELLYKMLTNPRTEPSTRTDLIKRWVYDSEDKGGDSLRVMQVFNKVLALPQTTSEVAELKAAYLDLKHAPKDSIMAAWREVLAIMPENTIARLQLIQQMWADTIDSNVIEECKRAIEYIPEEPTLYLYLATAQHINELQDDAIATLQKATDYITKDTEKDIASDIYSLMGDIYQNKSEYGKAFEAYEKAIEYTPDKVSILNNYAYALSEEGKDLKKAEKMGYKAITAEPNNAIYLDTYAWILYKQGQYDDANAYIDMAIENLKEGDDPDDEIKKHATEIKEHIK